MRARVPWAMRVCGRRARARAFPHSAVVPHLYGALRARDRIKCVLPLLFWRAFSFVISLEQLPPTCALACVRVCVRVCFFFFPSFSPPC